MKRRIFLSTTGIVGASLSSGFASAGSLMTPLGSWHFDKELDSKFVESLDEFAHQVTVCKKSDVKSRELIKNLVSPKEIISHNPDQGILIYRNFVDDEVTITTKNGNTVFKIKDISE